MPVSKSKRKGKKHAGRGRVHTHTGGIRTLADKVMPMWDEDVQALQLDVELAYRILQEGKADAESIESAVCTLAARFEMAALIASHSVASGRVWADAIRNGISYLHEAWSAYLEGRPTDAETWHKIEYALDVSRAVEDLATRQEWSAAVRAVRERAQRVMSEKEKET